MDQGRADIFEIARDAEAGVFGERASVLDMPAMDYSRRTFSRKPSAYYTPMVLKAILYYISHGW